MLRSLVNLIARKPRVRLQLQRLYCAFSKHVKLLPPLGVAIEMTYACNWRCRMCFHHRPDARDRMVETLAAEKDRELTTAELLDLVSAVSKMRVRHVSFHGGEPLIRKDFCDLVEQAAALGLHTSTFTNGTLITDDVARRLAGTLTDLGVSIHGGEQTHDAVTGIPGSYRKAIDGILRLQQAKREAGTDLPSIGLVCVVSALNYEHLDEMIDVTRELGLPGFGVSMVTFTDRNAMANTCSMLESELETENPYLGDSLLPGEVLEVDPAAYKRSVDALKESARRAGIEASVHPFKSEEEIGSYFANPLSRLGGLCNYPWYSSVVSAYGDVYPCIQFSFLGFRMGNVREQPFREIWHGETYRAYRRKFGKKGCYLPVCAKCCSVVEEG